MSKQLYRTTIHYLCSTRRRPFYRYYFRRYPDFYRRFSPLARPRTLGIHKADNRAVVDLRYGFLFNRIPKAANTTLMGNLYQHDAGQGVPLKDIAARHKSGHVVPSELSRDEVERLRGVFKFLVVRNPYSRTLSAYLSKIAKSDDKRKDYMGKAPRLFQRFGPQPTFADFCRYLDSGGLHDNKHWAPQTSLMVLPAEEFDFTGKLENLKREFLPLFESAWEEPAPIKRKMSRKVVLRHERDDGAYYVKIYSRRHAGGLGHNLLRGSSLSFLSGKARKHLRKALALQSLGILVAEPCMVIERRYGFLRQESMLVTPEYDMPSLGQYFREAGDWASCLPALENMIADISRMHEGGYVQRDPHPGNVLVRGDQRVIWLDFGTVRRLGLDTAATYRDLQTLWDGSVALLSPFAPDAQRHAAQLLAKHYARAERLRRAVPEAVQWIEKG